MALDRTIAIDPEAKVIVALLAQKLERSQTWIVSKMVLAHSAEEWAEILHVRPSFEKGSAGNATSGREPAVEAAGRPGGAGAKDGHQPGCYPTCQVGKG